MTLTRGQLAGLLASRREDWGTPPELFAALDREFGFTLDACASAENAKCRIFFSREENGLAQPWFGVVFCNPPYGRQIGRWVRKAWESARAGATVVCLLPARTDTQWWHCWAMRGEVRFLRGRIRFVGARWNAPFPLAVVIFRPGAGRAPTTAG